MDLHGRILIELDRLGPGEVVGLQNGGLQILQGLADIMNATGLTVIL